MAVTAQPYGQALLKLGEGVIDFSTDTFKIMLTTDAYAPDWDAHEFKSDVTDEITGTGYTAGGATLTGVAWTYLSGQATLAADSVIWTTATFTAHYAVIYKNTGVAGTSPLLSYVDFDANRSPAGVDFEIAFADGVLVLGM